MIFREILLNVLVTADFVDNFNCVKFEAFAARCLISPFLWKVGHH
jgi:hypothetical protein